MALFKRKNKDKILDTVKETRNSSSQKYRNGLKKSREGFTKKIRKLATKHRKIDEQYFTDLEELLIMSDVGVSYVSELIPLLKTEVKIKNISDPSEMSELIFEFLFKKYLDKKADVTKLNLIDGELNTILIMGVNGVGKTTTIGKLTKMLIDDGKKVALAAADTFRAGAVAQLKVWADRNHCDITVPVKEGVDPASVAYEAIAKAKENKPDVLIIDTAGRLQNKENLMNELLKLNKIIERESGRPTAETLLVLDATTGQNGVHQAAAFNEVANLTGIVLTKMDSSARGGIILNIKDTFEIPVKFIGLGESIDDLEEFDLEKYIRALIIEGDDE